MDPRHRHERQDHDGAARGDVPRGGRPARGAVRQHRRARARRRARPGRLRRARRRALELPAAPPADDRARGARTRGPASCLNIADDHLDWHGSPEAYRDGEGHRLREHPGRVRLQPRRRGDAAHGRGRRGRGGRARHRLRARRAGPERLRRGRGHPRATAPSSRSAAPPRSSSPRVDELEPHGLGAPHIVANILAASALARARTASRSASIRDAPRATSASTRTASRRWRWPAASAGSTTRRRPTRTPPRRRSRAFGTVVWIVGGLLKGVDADALVAAPRRAPARRGRDRRRPGGPRRGVPATRAGSARLRGRHGRH